MPPLLTRRRVVAAVVVALLAVAAVVWATSRSGPEVQIAQSSCPSDLTPAGSRLDDTELVEHALDTWRDDVQEESEEENTRPLSGDVCVLYAGEAGGRTYVTMVQGGHHVATFSTSAGAPGYVSKRDDLHARDVVLRVAEGRWLVRDGVRAPLEVYAADRSASPPRQVRRKVKEIPDVLTMDALLPPAWRARRSDQEKAVVALATYRGRPMALVGSSGGPRLEARMLAPSTSRNALRRALRAPAGTSLFVSGVFSASSRSTEVSLVARTSIPGQGHAMVVLSSDDPIDRVGEAVLVRQSGATATAQDPVAAPTDGPWSAALWSTPEDGTPAVVAVGMPPPGRPKDSLDLTVLVGSDRVTGTGPVTVVTAEQVPALADQPEPPAAVVVGRTPDGSVVPFLS